jgi:hypothetical protein
MATRTNRKIEITFDVSGEPAFVNVQTRLEGTSGLITMTEMRDYFVAYADLGTAAQGRIDDFINDVNTWLNSQEPLA